VSIKVSEFLRLNCCARNKFNTGIIDGSASRKLADRREILVKMRVGNAIHDGPKCHAADFVGSALQLSVVGRGLFLNSFYNDIDGQM
jgi:hypothetical protein